MKICLVGEWANRNYGDVLIHFCMRNLIRKYLSPCNIFSVPSTVGFETKEFRRNHEEIIRTAADSDLTIIGGGGLLRFFVFGTIPIKDIVTPYIGYALGWNEFYDSRAELSDLPILKSVESKALFFSARNDGSHKIYDGHVFKKSIDPAFLAQQNFPNLKRPFDEDYVVFNIAYEPAVHRKIPNDFFSVIRNLAKFINNKGYRIILLPHRQSDLKIEETLRGTDFIPLNWNQVTENITLALSFYQYASFVIGMRGHAQIIPYSFGTPIINISTQQKNKGLMDELGLMGQCIGIKDFSLRELKFMVNMVCDENFYNRNHMEDLLKYNDEQWKEIKRIVYENRSGN